MKEFANLRKLGIYLLFIIGCIICKPAAAQYGLTIVPVDREFAFAEKQVKLSANFKTLLACQDYVAQLPDLLAAKGFPAASVDSVQFDSTSARATVYFGPAYQIGYISTAGIDPKLLGRAGWNETDYTNQPVNFRQLETVRLKMLDYFENNGYPFAHIQLDSLRFNIDTLYAALRVEKGPLYDVDSIRNFGTAFISNNFLQRYLDITNGSLYQKKKLEDITRKLRELPYVEEEQPWDISMVGTGSVVNLYLKPKKSSQINVLLGLLPSSTNELDQSTKLRVTGEATINLRNALGNGEFIGVNWQQLQVQSPRLDLSFEQPYMFKSPFGITSSFNLFKKDSSFLNLNLLLGAQYAISSRETGKVFIQNLRTNLLSVDTVAIKSSKRLPDERDVSSINFGVDYWINKTDYRFNPRKGSELNIVTSAGTRKVRKNNMISKLSSPDFSYESLYDSTELSSYQFRVKIQGAHYIPLTRQSTIKTAMNIGWFQTPDIYRNELFQIGGYKLLRGFDEESIYASQYGVATVEYRYLLGLNSFLFTFADIGYSQNKSVGQNLKNNYIGAGLGMAFEAKTGMFNISYAVGKRDDVKFNLRQSKIHLGYVNYF